MVKDVSPTTSSSSEKKEKKEKKSKSEFKSSEEKDDSSKKLKKERKSKTNLKEDASEKEKVTPSNSSTVEKDGEDMDSHNKGETTSESGSDFGSIRKQVSSDSFSEDDDAADADDLLNEDVEIKQKDIQLKENKKHRRIQKLKSKKQLEDSGDDDDEEIPWFKEKECLLLLLESRMILKEMIRIKFKQERIASGDLSVQEIQSLLRAQKEEQETDWIAEIQELKRNLVSEIRKNHQLERELSKLDKRIALLIKNRGNIQEVLASHSASKKKSSNSDKGTEIVSDPRKLEHYQNLFYLLQTEPKYMANLVYLMQAEQMESFLDTVILTLYGDAFSPREEFLILKLFQLAIQKEMSAITKVSDFLKADSVVPKMVITYNRRKQGLEFLKTVLGPILKNFIAKEYNLELKPAVVYQAMISEQEIKTGERSTLKRDLTEDQIMELKEVQEIINGRINTLQEICQSFFDGIISSLNKLPYGIRWICKQIRHIAEQNFQNSSKDEILKVTGYFVYYRFINLAIVTPDAFEIIDKELSQIARKNLVSVAKVLQNLFNLSLFGKADKWLIPLNKWITKHLETVRDYFTDLISVADPEDYLQVDKYMELTQKTKPVIIISLHEIASSHSLIHQCLDKLAKEKDDPLRLIMTDLGEVPVISSEDDREIQLTLTNRFKQNMEEEISSSANLYAETKELIINTFRLIPVQGNENDQTLLGILKTGKKFAKDKNDDLLVSQIDKILENISGLEKDEMIFKADNYSSFLRDIALEVANRAEIREQQRKEIKRLNQTLRNLRKHQKYLVDQIQQYNDYLQDCRLKHYQPKKSKKKAKSTTSADGNPNKIGPFKFSYSALSKKGVILDSEVPQISRKATTFYISSEAVGVFDIVAKIKGIAVEKMTLELDDLLERNYNNITRLELDQVTLDVNMTIHLINKFFLK